MADEFRINSSAIESKINQLLPSQGGQGAGVDFSASTMVIPIVDLTESAEGSSLRADLQTSLSHKSVTSFDVVNTSTTIISTTGYFRVYGIMGTTDSTNVPALDISITDGSTTKILIDGNVLQNFTGAGLTSPILFDFNVLLQAGDSVIVNNGYTNIGIKGTTRQLASLDGTLTNP
jgi:hypothetical protein